MFRLQNIIHDWDDDRNIKVLVNCYNALPSSGKVIMIDALLPTHTLAKESLDDLCVCEADITMMAVSTCGRERDGATSLPNLASQMLHSWNSIICMWWKQQSRNSTATHSILCYPQFPMDLISYCRCISSCAFKHYSVYPRQHDVMWIQIEGPMRYKWRFFTSLFCIITQSNISMCLLKSYLHCLNNHKRMGMGRVAQVHLW